MAHGMHVTFISELKNALNKRKDKEPEFSITPKFIDNPFLDSLVERKNSLKIITPPPERKLILWFPLENWYCDFPLENDEKRKIDQ